MNEEFPKAERLCAKKDIDHLFANGLSVRSKGIVIKFTLTESKGEELPQMVMFSVPKRNIKQAVRRNRIKRMLREIYRCNRHWWTKISPEANKTLHLGVIYTGRQVPAFRALHKACEEAVASIDIARL